MSTITVPTAMSTTTTPPPTAGRPGDYLAALSEELRGRIISARERSMLSYNAVHAVMVLRKANGTWVNIANQETCIAALKLIREALQALRSSPTGSADMTVARVEALEAVTALWENYESIVCELSS